MLRTLLCHQLGIEHPIFSVGMGPTAGPELAAAVSNVGGCGVLGGNGTPAPYLRQEIQRLRVLTDKPFGVNLLLPHLQEGQIEACLDEKQVGNRGRCSFLCLLMLPRGSRLYAGYRGATGG